jgi:hypothetical protein
MCLRVLPRAAVMAMADGARTRSALVVPAHDGDAPSGSQFERASLAVILSAARLTPNGSSVALRPVLANGLPYRGDVRSTPFIGRMQRRLE